MADQLSIEEQLAQLQKKVQSLEQRLRVKNPSQIQPGFALNRDLHDLGEVPHAIVSTASDTIPSGVDTKIDFSTRQIDSEEIIDLTNDWFSVPVRGLYLVTGSIRWSDSTSTGERRLTILVDNGAGGAWVGSSNHNTAAGMGAQLTVTSLMGLSGPEVDTNRRVYFNAFQGSGTDKVIGDGWFGIVLVASISQ